MKTNIHFDSISLISS